MEDIIKLQKNLYYRAIYMILLISITIATIIFLPLYIELKKDKDREFHFSNKLKEENIKEYFNELKATTLQITSRTKAREILNTFNKKKIPLSEAKNRIEYILTDALNLSNTIVGISRFDFNKKLIANVGIYLQNDFKNKIDNFVIKKFEDNFLIVITTPIIDRNNKLVGYDRVAFKIDGLKKIINSYSNKDLKSYIGYMQNNNFISLFDDKNINLKELNDFIIEKIKIKNTNLFFLVINKKDKFYSIINHQIIRLIVVVILTLIIGILGIYTLSKPILTRLKVEIKQRQEYQNHLEQRVKEEVQKRLKQEQLLIQQSKILSMAEMMSAIAHQWRQPLNIIGLAVQDVTCKFEDKELTQKDLIAMEDVVMDEVELLSKTIDNFSNFFKPSKDKEVFNIVWSILNIIDLTYIEFQENSINYRLFVNGNEIDLTLNRELINNKILLFGYQGEFEHAILNIILNSKDAIEKELNKKVIKSGEIIIDIKSTKRKVTITISDNGGGIKEKILDKIFEPYFTTKFSSQGVGIGLYMTKMLIEKSMDGKIYGANGNSGAKFTIEIDL